MSVPAAVLGVKGDEVGHVFDPFRANEAEFPDSCASADLIILVHSGSPNFGVVYMGHGTLHHQLSMSFRWSMRPSEGPFPVLFRWNMYRIFLGAVYALFGR